MITSNNNACALCFKEFVDGDKVRGIHPTKGIIFHKYHTFPDGETDSGRRLPGLCKLRHDEPHIHEECVTQWQDKFNIEPTASKEEALLLMGRAPRKVPTLPEHNLLSNVWDGMICPNCPHSIGDHWDITEQVIKCKICACEF